MMAIWRPVTAVDKRDLDPEPVIMKSDYRESVYLLQVAGTADTGSGISAATHPYRQYTTKKPVANTIVATGCL